MQYFTYLSQRLPTAKTTRLALALSAVLGRLHRADHELLVEWMNVFAARIQRLPHMRMSDFPNLP
ncbi:hypothetical protein PT2222_320071 [Paraburkholderia tropica]